MPRILLLALFVALCSTAFVASNLWAGGESSPAGSKKYKKHEKKSFDSLAKALKSSKRGSTVGKIASKKQGSTLKSSHRAAKSKKISGTKSKYSRKVSFLKSRSHNKTAVSVHSRSPKKTPSGAKKTLSHTSSLSGS
jgi:hypothetical protein